MPATANIWSAPGTSGLWNTATNWSLGHVPTSIEIATYASSAASCQIDSPATGTNSVSGINVTSTYLGSITDTADLMIGGDGFVGGMFMVSGSTTITVGGDWSENVAGGFSGGSGMVVFNSSSSQTIQDTNSIFNNLTHSGSGTLNLTAGIAPLTLGGNFVNSAGTVDARGASITLNAASGSGNWTDSSSVLNLGTVTLSGNASRTLSANSTFNNLTYSGNPTLTLATALTVTGNLTVATSSLSAGALDANGQNITVSGLTTITDGLLETFVASSTEVMNFMGGLSINGGTLDCGAGRITLGGGIAATSFLGGPSTIFGRLDFGGTSRTLTVSRGDAFRDLYVFAVISNGGSLTKNGDGIVELANTNTYSSGTIINAGILDVSKDGALGPGTGGTSVAAGAILQFSGNVTYNTPEAVTLNGGTIAMQAGFAMASFAGPIFLNAAGSIISAQGGMFILTGPINAAGFDLTVVAPGDVTINGNLNAGSTLTKQGAGTLTINGTNSFMGGINVQGGALAVGNDNAVGAGTLTLGNGTAILAAGADHSIANAVTLGGNIMIGASPNTLTFTGNVSGSGSLTLNGNLTLTG